LLNQQESREQEDAISPAPLSDSRVNSETFPLIRVKPKRSLFRGIFGLLMLMPFLVSVVGGLVAYRFLGGESFLGYPSAPRNTPAQSSEEIYQTLVKSYGTVQADEMMKSISQLSSIFPEDKQKIIETTMEALKRMDTKSLDMTLPRLYFDLLSQSEEQFDQNFDSYAAYVEAYVEKFNSQSN